MDGVRFVLLPQSRIECVRHHIDGSFNCIPTTTPTIEPQAKTTKKVTLRLECKECKTKKCVACFGVVVWGLGVGYFVVCMCTPRD